MTQMRRVRDLHIGKYFLRRDSAEQYEEKLSDFLYNWRRALHEYEMVAASAADLGYWYNERANVGFLAAAVWKMGRGNVALEEYTVQRDKKRGRCDLWVSFERFEIVIEAKVMWPKSTRSLGARINKRLERAEKQIEKLEDDELGHWGLAACFVVPRIECFCEADVEGIHETLGRYWSKIYEEYGKANSIIGLYESSIETQRKRWLQDRKALRTGSDAGVLMYPGVALVLRKPAA